MAFTDLAKSFDTSNNALFVDILGKYGAPPKLCSAIKHIYNKSVVKLINSMIETSIDFKVGVKQGYIMDQDLFQFLMMAFVKNLEDKCTSLVLRKS